MRKEALDALFPRVRQELLAAVLLHPERWWYGTELSRHLGLPPSSLQRELAALTEAGIFRRRDEGRQVYYQANADCPYLGDLQGLLAKTAGIVDVLKDALAGHTERIEVSFVFGSIARGEELATSDVDLLVVGSTGRFDLTEPIHAAEERLAREVNPVIYTPAEFREKITADSRFLRTIVDEPHMFVIGNAGDLEKLIGEGRRGEEANLKGGD